MSAPCYNCPDRFVGCHGVCGKYLSYNERRLLERARKNKNSCDGYFAYVGHRREAARNKQIMRERVKG